MAIKTAIGPESGEALVSSAYTAMTPASPNLFLSEDGGTAPAVEISQPIPVFVVDLERLGEGGIAALGEAKRIGWRYLVGHGRKLDVVDLPEDRNRGADMLAGPAAAGQLAKSGRVAERIADGEIEYEPRLLDLSPLRGSVLWLHNAEHPSTDRFVSLTDNPGELQAESFGKRIQNAARRKLGVLSAAKSEGEAGG